MRRVRPSHRALALALAALAGSLLPGRLVAQLPDPSRELELIESTERDDDPLSLDELTGRGLDQAAANLPKQAPPPPPSAETGEALSAIDGVEEQQHRVTITLESGLALVETRLTFTSRAMHAAEVAYRLPLPEGAVVTRVARCRDASCEEALPHADTPPSVPSSALALAMTPIVDVRGHAAALRMSPITKGASVELRVHYVAPAPLRGGRVRFTLPARGADPRIAEADVRIVAAGLTVLPGLTLRHDPALPLAITASMREGTGSASRVTSPCGTGTCTRAYERRGPLAPIERATWLWIDASPSMEGPARGRASAVVSALLSLLPERTPLRALAFAARAEALGTFAVDAAPLATLADATLLKLDAASKPSAAVALVAEQLTRERPRVLVISDGLFDPVQRELDALHDAKQRGAQLWLLHVGDEAPRLAGAFDEVLTVAQLADAAARNGELAPLIDALRAVVMPQRGSVRAGEQRVDEQHPRSRWTLTAGAPWLTYWLARDRVTPHFARGAQPARDAVAAVPFVSAPPRSEPDSTGMPKESVLAMLRAQLIPAARACLRGDRKGRADYAVELTFHALFSAREVYDARVEGDLPAALRGCLEAILPRLQVPAFSGRIRVHYPIHTAREPPPPRVELEDEVARDLGRAFGPLDALP